MASTYRRWPLWRTPDSHIVAVKQLDVEPKEKTPDDMRVSSEEESIDLPFFATRSKRANTSRPNGKNKICTLVPQHPNCEVC